MFHLLKRSHCTSGIQLSKSEKSFSSQNSFSKNQTSSWFSFQDKFSKPVQVNFPSAWLDSFGIGKDDETVRKCTGLPVKSASYVRNFTPFKPILKRISMKMSKTSTSGLSLNFSFLVWSKVRFLILGVYCFFFWVLVKLQ